MRVGDRLFEAPLDTLRAQALGDRPAFMASLKAAGMRTMGERLAFEQQLLHAVPAAPAIPGLPKSFLESAFPTKREYEASLLLKPEDRVFAENAARRKVNAGIAVGEVETPKQFHGRHSAATEDENGAAGPARATTLSTFEFHAPRAARQNSSAGAGSPGPPMASAMRVRRPPRLADVDGTPDPLWADAAPVAIRHFHERSGWHRPTTEVRLLYDDTALYVRFDVRDDRRELMMARFVEPNQATYRDSCVELFLDTGVHAGYMNLEMNCLGAILLQTHAVPRQGGSINPSLWNARIERWTSVDPATLRAPAAAGPITWAASVRLPFALVSELVSSTLPAQPRPPAHADSNATNWWRGADPGTWRIGLYKCADDSPEPHWGSWMPLGEKLDFHQPSRFGSLIFE